MKKVILCISLVLLCLMLNNCGTNKNELCGLPRRIYNKIQEGYINDITEGRKTEAYPQRPPGGQRSAGQKHWCRPAGGRPRSWPGRCPRSWPR